MGSYSISFLQVALGLPVLVLKYPLDSVRHCACGGLQLVRVGSGSIPLALSYHIRLEIVVAYFHGRVFTLLS